jgi:hypothetical protein
MNPESLHPAPKHRYRLTVACIAVAVSLVAAVAALANVPAVRDHLCYEHRMNIFCSISQIGESDIKVFAWYPEVKPFDRDAPMPRRILSEIPPYQQRTYSSSFPSGTRQWVYWEARLSSRAVPGQPIKFLANWTTFDAGGRAVASGVLEAVWGADDPAVMIIGPADNDPIRTVGQLPPGHYEVVLKVYGNQLAESEIRGGFDMY